MDGKSKVNKLMKYFGNSIPFIASGAVLILAGFLIYWYSFEIWMIGTPVMVVGLALLVVGLALRVNDGTYQAFFDTKIDSLTSGRRVEVSPDYTAAEYSFDGNKYSKLDSSQAPRSELYVKTDLYIGKKALTAESFHVNAADDTISDEKVEFPLESVSMSVESKDIKCGKSTKKASLMTISADGAKTLVFPVRYNDIGVDQLIERIESVKKKLQK